MEQYIDISKGRLDAKLAVTNEQGDETWLPFDTRTATTEPDGKIMVFKSATGCYEQADNLEHAREMFEKLYEEWRVPVAVEPPEPEPRYNSRGKRIAYPVKMVGESE